MKYIFLPIIIFLTVIGFAASSKLKKHPKEKPELSGEWKGSYSVEEGPLVNDIIFDFIQGQLIQVFDGSKSWGDEAKGEYALTGDSLHGKYVYKLGVQNQVSIKGQLNKNKNQLTGTWEWVKGKGKFVIKRGAGS